jgi:uncharacterized damage-inducible protein DinB
MKDKRIDEVLRHLEPQTGARPWHGGPTVVGALRGVSPEVAAWKPHPDRHSIWDLALHIAYWKYAVQRRLTDAPRGGFPRSPSNFPNGPEKKSAETWDEDRKLVRTCHDSLVEAVSLFDAGRLDEYAGKGTKTTYTDLVTGILLHDTYHVGQIQMLKRMAGSLG